MSMFSSVPVAPADPILGIKALFLADPSTEKVNVSIGAYRTDDGKPKVLKCVQLAEEEILNAKLDKEYLPQRGNQNMCKLAREIVFGTECAAIKEGRVCTVQSLSGTGGLRVAADFIAQFLNRPTIYCSKPTWGNHLSIAKASNLPVATYRYWDAQNRCLDISGMLADLEAAPKGSVILLHACAHNPTGVDPTKEQWAQIAEVMKRNGLFPWFDSAYQGFASGSLEEDAFAIRFFADMGFEMVLCQSFAKNFGLYGERVGTVSVVTADTSSHVAIMSQLDVIIRTHYSNPPLHGARIVEKILSSPKLTQLWFEEMREMSSRIIDMRRALRAHLEELKTPGTWEHITSQIGMFSFTGLTEAQCEQMMKKHHVYLLKSGRVSMAGVTSGNVKYIAQAIDDVVRNY